MSRLAEAELTRIDRELETQLAARPYLAYVPNPSQIAMHKSLAFERWLFAGNGTGKDALMTNEFIWHCLGDYPAWYPEAGKINPTRKAIRARYCCTTFNDGIKQVVLPEFDKWARGLYRYNQKDNCIVFPSTGSQVFFKTYDQDDLSFSGANLHLVGQSEHCPKNKYEENLARLRGDGIRRFMGQMTPTEGMSWEYDDIFEAFETRQRTLPELEVLRGCTQDNLANLSEAYVKRFEKLDDRQRRIRLYGDFVAMSGLIYPEYRDWDHKEIRYNQKGGGHLIDPFPIPASWPRSMCIDPHNRKPFAMLWRAISPDGTSYYYDEYKPEQGGMLVSEYADVIRQKEGPLHNSIGYRLIDTSARIQDPIVGHDVQTELGRHGIHTRTVKGEEKRVDPGIQKIKERLTFTPHILRPDEHISKIYIFKNLYGLRYELKHYVWDDYSRVRDNKDAKDKPIKKHDDLLDCMKYLEQSGSSFEPFRVHKMFGSYN